MIPKTKVICVEDDQRWQDIIGEIGAMLGYQVEFASNSKDAIYMLKRSTYHVALLDKRLDENDPENEDGLSIATVIAGLDEGTRIIIYTAYGNIKDAREAFRKIKVRDFIGKDRPMSEIRKALEEASEQAILEFQTPSRATMILNMEDNSIGEFLSAFSLRTGVASNEQNLELLARRLLNNYRPLLSERKEAQIISLNQVSILQIKFWSKMLGSPIIAWFGKFNEVRTMLQEVDTDDALRSSLGIRTKIIELFDLDAFPEFGGAVFESVNVDFEQFDDRLTFKKREA